MKALAEYLKKNPKKKLIFDLDETILQLLLPWEIWYEKLRDLIVNKDPELWNMYDGSDRTIHQLMNEFARKYGTEAKTQITQMSTEFEKLHLKGTRNNNELIQFIKDNKDRYKMYVWSSNTDEIVCKVLEDVGLLSHFETIVSQTNVKFIKPDPDGFSLIHDGESDIKEYVFIGDSKSDEGVAAALGMDFFKVQF